MILRRTVPRRSIAAPKLAGNDEAISRRTLDATLQPLPDVVMPICRGPSLCVERRVKVHRLGASITLTGIRMRLQRLEMCVPASAVQDMVRNEIDFRRTWGTLPARRYKHCVHHVINLVPSKS